MGVSAKVAGRVESCGKTQENTAKLPGHARPPERVRKEHTAKADLHADGHMAAVEGLDTVAEDLGGVREAAPDDGHIDVVGL